MSEVAEGHPGGELLRALLVLASEADNQVGFLRLMYGSKVERVVAALEGADASPANALRAKVIAKRLRRLSAGQRELTLDVLAGSRTWSNIRTLAGEALCVGEPKRRSRAEFAFHVSDSRNRESISVYGFDVSRMRHRGIAGARGPELEGVYLSLSLSRCGFFLGFDQDGRECVDLWRVEINGRELSRSEDNYDYVLGTIPPDRVSLVLGDFRQTSAVEFLRTNHPEFSDADEPRANDPDQPEATYAIGEPLVRNSPSTQPAIVPGPGSRP